MRKKPTGKTQKQLTYSPMLYFLSLVHVFLLYPLYISVSYLLSVREDEAIQVEPKEPLTNETQSNIAMNYETGRPSSRDNFPSKKESGCMSTAWKISLNLKCRLSSIARARILERVPFESEKPFFKVLMQPTYVGPKAESLVSFSVCDLLLTTKCK